MKWKPSNFDKIYLGNNSKIAQVEKKTSTLTTKLYINTICAFGEFTIRLYSPEKNSLVKKNARSKLIKLVMK